MYHYTESGLRNIWLSNGYHVKQTPYGEGISIEGVEGLHRTIGLGLMKKAGRLTGAEFRFLRKEQDLSQKGLGNLIGVDGQRLNRWETHKTAVPRWADRILRVIYREYTEDNAQIRGFVDRINELDAKEYTARQFSLQDDNTWTEAAEAEAA